MLTGFGKKEKLYKVNVRGGFSDRMGIKPINLQMQTGALDERSRTALINVTNQLCNIIFRDDYAGWTTNYIGNEKMQEFIKCVLADVYQMEVEYNPDSYYQEDKFFDIINKTIREDDFDDVLTLIEYLADCIDKCFYGARKDIIYNSYNMIFEREYVGYRFVGGKIVEITNEEEIQELKEALEIPFDNVEKHIRKALDMLSDRSKPDYENSIKESISSVEAMCEIILGQKGSLGDTLKKIEKEGVVPIHPALKEAFLKLYGYTSDAESGIRHAASIGGKDSTFAEARYMLVTCVAFINYLKVNMPK